VLHLFGKIGIVQSLVVNLPAFVAHIVEFLELFNVVGQLVCNDNAAPHRKVKLAVQQFGKRFLLWRQVQKCVTSQIFDLEIFKISFHFGFREQLARERKFIDGHRIAEKRIDVGEKLFLAVGFAPHVVEEVFEFEWVY